MPMAVSAACVSLKACRSAGVDCQVFRSGGMVQVSRRAGITDSALIRLLARLTDIVVTDSKQSVSHRLSPWFSWTDAIALSAALDGGPATAQSSARSSASAEEAECVRVRAALVKAIAEDGTSTAETARGHRHAPARSAATIATAGFSPHRQRYLARQQAMEESIGPLRSRLRARLAARSPSMARLAAVDAVMEQALGAHEQRLLSTVPALLEKRFERLRQTHQAMQGDAQAPAPPDSEVQPEAWLDRFCKDMQSVSLAELDIRLQPVEGLLEALRMS